ncbi:unnamed protein product [Anisakis simplex]|uniref:Transmembrane cell adhesion receptor mua-3 (inferred by orthology to a C. elegans protein) n=1 Tax=Anisakis simplex TaxID=6269 RepID=A0A0M3IZK5_ANISI|nr:unnamed protein product [Anisakis simplex]
MPSGKIRLLLVTVICGAYSVLAQGDSYDGVSSYDTVESSCKVNDPLSCDQNKSEVCTFKDGAYKCECPTGVNRLPDGRCILIDECAEPRLNDCHENARCLDQDEGYMCECLIGYADVSEDITRKPGRICQAEINECLDPAKYHVDCSENAACQDTAESYTCVCRPGFADISARYSLLPGRKCVEVINECANGENDCSPNADCIDQPDGYLCKCRAGYVDASPNVTHYPGRECNAPRSPEYYGYSQQNIPVSF